MNAKLDIKRLIKALFPEDDPFVENEGKRFLKYDEIRLELLDKNTEVTFYYKGKGYITIKMDQATSRGIDTITLQDLQGLAEIDGI